MQAPWLLLFTSSTVMLLWTYLLYPMLILAVGARHRARTVAEAARAGAASRTAPLPRVAVLIAACDESEHIGGRVRNLVQQQYPRELLTALIGSDGSVDDTVSCARNAAAGAGGATVRIFDFRQNRGKAAVLNDLCMYTDAEVLVFSDANTVFAPDTLRQLVAPFEDPQVGAVCGELLLRPQGAGGSQDYAYWNVERRLKAAESTIGGLLGANGGVYAIRRALFGRLQPDTICDDFVIAMNVAAAGWKSVYCAAAIAWEHAPHDEASEFKRRVRIGIGNYQALFRHPEYLFRAPWPLRFTYLSHKVLRWFTPVWLLGLLGATAGLYGQPPFGLLLSVQALGYAMAVLVYLTRRLAWPALLRGGMLFLVLNAAFVVALVRYLCGNYRGSWRRTVRT